MSSNTYFMQSDGGAGNKKTMGSKMPSNGNIIEIDSAEVENLVNNMNSGTNDINALIDSMARSVENLDGIWKGETKEVFVQELAVLHRLVKKNSDEVKFLANRIRKENRLYEQLKQAQTQQSGDIY